MGAPVVAILAYDMRFYEHLPRLFHNPQARSWYETTPEHIRTTALRNATLQGAYLILAARAIGLDCGPMSGFNNDKVDAAFFPDGRFKSNFLCCLGRGDPATLPKQDHRFDFDEACTIV
jgi:3-hydroxypropanoate dehydrogenase